MLKSYGWEMSKWVFKELSVKVFEYPETTNPEQGLEINKPLQGMAPTRVQLIIKKSPKF